jgi:predicted phosphodiesterase
MGEPEPPAEWDDRKRLRSLAQGGHPGTSGRYAGDLPALQDALPLAEAEGCIVVVCGGDVVDCRRHPNETATLLRERAIPTVRGNHHLLAVDREAKVRAKGGAGELSDETCAWLSALPKDWTSFIDGVVVTVTHARPGSDFHGIDPQCTSDDELERFLDRSGATVLLVGHTHEPFERRLADGRLVANPAALLRDPVPGLETPPATASMGILELPSLRWRCVAVEAAVRAVA